MAKVHVDFDALGDLLRSDEIREMLAEAAEAVADDVRGQNLTVSSGAALPVQVRFSETDRVVARIELAHPAGLAMQAKYGALTKAAAAGGLEVTER